MQPLFKTLIVGFFFGLLPLVGFAQDINSHHVLHIINFDDGDAPERTGIWVHNIMDPEQGLKMEILEQGKNKILRLDYDVDSPNPAMVGFWANARNQDLRDFGTLHVNLKAGENEPFLGNIAFQFTDANNRKAAYLVSRVPTEWKEFQVPLKNFKRIDDWSQIKEFEIIIDDINARPKEGVLFVDEIYVSKDR